MPTKRVMSWNIENIGESKFTEIKRNAEVPQQDGEFLAAEFIQAVITAFNIDVLGAIEIVGGIGNPLTTLITANLGAAWRRAVSSQQQHRTRKEQAIYVWREDANLRLWTQNNADTAPAISLINTIDDNAMAPLFATIVNNTPTQDEIYDALIESGYLYRSVKWAERAYRVKSDKWSELRNGDEVELLNDEDEDINPGLTPQQLTLLGEILLYAGLVLFPREEERSPFLLSLNLGPAGNTRKLLLSILHCPGPSTISVLPATANMSLCTQFRNAPHLLMMGDFNVTAEKERAAVYLGYDVLQDPGTGLWKFQATDWVESEDFFEVLTDPPIGATDLLRDIADTSLTSANQVHEDREDYTVNSYDRFFFKSQAEAIVPTNADAVDVPAAMNYENVDSMDIYQEQVALAGMRFLKSRYAPERMDDLREIANVGIKRARDERTVLKDELERERKRALTAAPKVSGKRTAAAASKIRLTDEELELLQEEIAELKVVIDTLRRQTIVVPINAAMAFATYRVISDHLPISVDLTF